MEKSHKLYYCTLLQIIPSSIWYGSVGMHVVTQLGAVEDVDIINKFHKLSAFLPFTTGIYKAVGIM